MLNKPPKLDEESKSFKKWEKLGPFNIEEAITK